MLHENCASVKRTNGIPLPLPNAAMPSRQKKYIYIKITRFHTY